MVILKRLPSKSIIDGLKGTIDFYLWMGIPCARKWPCSPGRKRAPAVESQWPAWSYAAKLWATLPPEIQDAYNRTAAGTNLTGRDLQVKAYITGYLES